MTSFKQWVLTAVTAALLAACATPTPENPYPGQGGDYFSYPNEADIADPKQIFDKTRLDQFEPGKTTKRDIAVSLGRPTWWTTSDHGTSRLGYDFHSKGGTVNIPGTVPVEFVFDAQNILVEADYPGTKSELSWDQETFAFVRVSIDAKFKVIDGIIPASWGGGTDKPGEESVYLGGYIRQRISVDRVIAGKIDGRRHVVLFTVSSPHGGRWKAYMLLAINKFGSVRVGWWDYEPYVCRWAAKPGDSANLKTVISEAQKSMDCRLSRPSDD